jgi:hypothetical protein
LRKNRQDLAFWFVKSTALIDSNPFLSRWNDTFWQLSSFYCRFSWTPKNPAKKYRIPLNFSMFFFPFSPVHPSFSTLQVATGWKFGADYVGGRSGRQMLPRLSRRSEGIFLSSKTCWW